MENNNLNFIPFQSIGKFVFDTNIELYRDELVGFRYEEPDKYNNEFYHSPDDSFFISVRKGILESIYCYETICYQDTNLIGLTLSELKQLLQTDYVGDVEQYDLGDEVPQFVYQFDEIGAQIWVKQDKVVTVIANGKASYSDEPFYD